MWGWHNRRYVWDKVASEWAGEEEWSIDKEKYQAIEDKRDFITFHTAGCQNIQLCTGRKLGDKKRKAECEEPRIVGPPDFSIHTREEGTSGSSVWRQQRC